MCRICKATLVGNLLSFGFDRRVVCLPATSGNFKLDYTMCYFSLVVSCEGKCCVNSCLNLNRFVNISRYYSTFRFRCSRLPRIALGFIFFGDGSSALFGYCCCRQKCVMKVFSTNVCIFAIKVTRCNYKKLSLIIHSVGLLFLRLI